MNRYGLLSHRAVAYALAAAVAALCVPVLAAPPARRPAKSNPNRSESMDLWYQLTADDQPVGWMHRTATRTDWHGQPAWKFVEGTDILNPVTRKKGIVNEVEYTSLDGTMLELVFNVSNQLGTDTTDAIFKGRYINAVINAPVIGSQTRVIQRSRVTLKPGVRLSPDTDREIPPKDLQEGKQIDRWAYEPLARKVVRTVITVVGETNEDLPNHPGADVWELSQQTEGSPMGVLEWVNPHGIAVKIEISLPGIPDIIGTVTPHTIAAKH